MFTRRDRPCCARWLAAALAFALSGGAFGQLPGPYNANRGNDLGRFKKDTEGWYFYKDPKEIAPKPLEPAPPPPLPEAKPDSAPHPPPLRPMSVAWVQKHLPIVRDAAIDDPTPANVRMYLYMQRIMLDKAENFTKAAVLAGTSDPSLNEDVRIPKATGLAMAQNNRQRAARLAAIRSLPKSAAIWVFVDSKCIYCETGVVMARRLAKAHQLELRLISVDGVAPKGALPGETLFDKNRAAFKRFGLKLVPATLIVAPPDKIGVIAHGAVSDVGTMESNLLVAMLSLKLVSDDLRAVLETRDKGLLTVEQIKEAETQSLASAKQRADEGDGRPAEATPDEVVRYVSTLIEKQSLR